MELEKFHWIPFEVKTFEEKSDRYEFEGHASIFHKPDRVKDIVHPGAFKRTIDHHQGKFPLDWMHDVKNIIGGGETHEDKKGFAVSPGFLIKGIPTADNVYKLMKAKVVDGMSFMYRAIQKEYKGGYRHLREVAVASLTLGPRSMICHPDALVTNVKFYDDIFSKQTEELAAILEGKIWEDEEDWTEVRYRVKNPDDFTRIRAWWIKENSIRALGGPLKSTGKTAIQALRFLKSAGWTLTKAKDWVKEHPDLKFYNIIAGLDYKMIEAVENIKAGLG
jgi:HK97 family phage prohead protease